MMAKRPASPVVMKLLLMNIKLMRLTERAIQTIELKIPFPTNLIEVMSYLVVIAKYVSPIVAARVAEAARRTLSAVYIEQM